MSENPGYRIFKKQNLSLEIKNLTENFNTIFKITTETINHKNTSKMNESENSASENCVTDLFKSLRIPDAVKDLPRYEGSRHTLYEFIENVEEILSLCNAIDGHPCSKIYLRAIRNKITGEANEVLTMYGTPLEWEAIKDNLITHYADKRNETNLVRDLYSTSQGSDSLEKYFARIIDIQSTIINHVKLNESSAIVIRAKRDLYQEMCLNTFLAGLREPMGSMIRAMQPTSLTEAFTNCLKEQNMSYMKKSNNVNVLPVPQRTAPKFLNGNATRNSYPSGPPILQQMRYSPNYNYKPTPQYYNHRPFTKQNPMASGNVQNNRFNFKPPMVPPRRAEPMDTTSNYNNYKQYSSINPNHNQVKQYSNGNQLPRQNYQFQPIGPPKIRSQELYTTEDQQEGITEECCEEEPPLYFPDLDEGEVDDENFLPEASHLESDT